jgi:hypothetical protein
MARVGLAGIARQTDLMGQPLEEVPAQLVDVFLDEVVTPFRIVRLRVAGGNDEVEVLFGCQDWGPPGGFGLPLSTGIVDGFTLFHRRYPILAD